MCEKLVICRVGQAFLGDATDYPSLIEAAEHYNRIVENIRIFVSEDTRSSASEDLDGGEIPPVTVTAPPIVRLPKLENPVIDPIDWGVTDPSSPTVPDDPNGQGKENSLKDGKYDKNEHIQTTSELVAEILDVIYGDCMGKTLIDAIGTDITIVVDTNKNSYDKNNRTIYFGEAGIYGEQRSSVMPFALMEELSHVYQRDRVSDEVFEGAKLNFEIEAKCGCFLRELRVNGQDPMLLRKTRTYNLFLGRNGTTAFCEMIIDDIIFDKDLPQEFRDIYYEDVINSLRSINEYSDINKYPESYSERKFDNLKELTKNCPEL